MAEPGWERQVLDFWFEELEPERRGLLEGAEVRGVFDTLRRVAADPAPA